MVDWLLCRGRKCEQRPCEETTSTCNLYSLSVSMITSSEVLKSRLEVAPRHGRNMIAFTILFIISTMGSDDICADFQTLGGSFS